MPVPASPAAAGSVRRAWSVKGALLGLLVPTLVAVFAIEFSLAARALHLLSDAAFDRSLAGAIKAIDANISTDSGGLAVELPYRMLEFFELTASGSVHFRVATEDRLVEIGSADLPSPPGPLVSGVPSFYDAVYLDQPVRVGAYARPLARPLYPSPAQAGPQRVMIQVVEATGSREAFSWRLLRQLIGRDLILVLLGSAAVIGAVLLALRPLDRVRGDLAGRPADDLTPVDREAVPAEVRPLVDALNAHIARFGRLADTQRQFLDDASHQLRTPLAVLKTQVDYAMREQDPAALRQALVAMGDGIDRASHVTNQLLQLARARDAALAGRASPGGPCDLVVVAEGVARALLPIARVRGLDFGFDATTATLPVAGDPLMLGEALSNLVHNAIRHAAPGGTVTVFAGGAAGSAAGEAWIGVDDDGPGMTATARAEAGRRFAGASSSGGLGLAIAKATAQAHRGRLDLAVPTAGHGLSARIVLPTGPGRSDASTGPPVPTGAASD